MADNMVVTAKIGETGKEISVVLKNTDPATGALVPKNLTGYTDLKMQVEKSNGTVIIDQVACIADPDQTVNTGKITCTLDVTVAAHPALIIGDFLLEFSGLTSTGKKRYWPTNKQSTRTYGRFIVQKALS